MLVQLPSVCLPMGLLLRTGGAAGGIVCMLLPPIALVVLMENGANMSLTASSVEEYASKDLLPVEA